MHNLVFIVLNVKVLTCFLWGGIQRRVLQLLNKLYVKSMLLVPFVLYMQIQADKKAKPDIMKMMITLSR